MAFKDKVLGGGPYDLVGSLQPHAVYVDSIKGDKDIIDTYNGTIRHLVSRNESAVQEIINKWTKDDEWEALGYFF